MTVVPGPVMFVNRRDSCSLIPLDADVSKIELIAAFHTDDGNEARGESP